MVKTYRKGYMAERELVHIMHSRGWAAIRSPRSGRMGMPLPDVVAIKSGRVLSFEVKSREPGFSIRHEQYRDLVEWKNMTGSDVYIAIRVPRKGWFCISLDDLPENLYIGKAAKLTPLDEVLGKA